MKLQVTFAVCTYFNFVAKTATTNFKVNVQLIYIYACVMQGTGLNLFDLKQQYPLIRGYDAAKNDQSKELARYNFTVN